MKLIIGGINTFFLLGTNLLLALIILSGVVTHAPFNKFYWLQADTSAIANAPEISRWTFWGLCRPDGKNGVSKDCDLNPAYPISPVDNFDTTTDVPSNFVSDRDSYYYLTRAAFSLFFVAWAFAFITLVTSVLTWCSIRLNAIASVFSFLAAVILLAAVSCQTAAVALAKKAFKDADTYAKIGPTMLGLSWAAAVCLMIVFSLSSFAACRRAFGDSPEGHEEHVEEYKPNEYENYSAPADTQLHREVSSEESTQAFEDPYAAQNANQKPAVEEQGSGIKFFKVRKTGHVVV